MKKTFTILSFIIGIALNAIAQTPGQPIKGVIVKGGKNPGENTLISLSGGVTNPSSPTKQNANIGNGYAFNANVYVPLYARGGNDNLAGKTSHFFSVGPNAGGEYFGSNKDYEISGFTPYNITGQSSSPGLAARGLGSPKVQGFKAELGVQSNFSFGQVTISPILNAAYLNIKQQAFAIVQSSSVNGQNRNFNLYTQAETKTNGFAFVPKLRLAYFPGKLGFFVDGNYTVGPSIKNETTTFTPQGAADAKGFYSIDQMLTGSNVATVKTTKYNNLSFNFGVSLALGRSISEKGVKRGITEPQAKGITEKGGKRNEIQVNDQEISFLAETVIEKSLPNNDQSNCVVLSNPKNGSSHSLKQDLEIKATFLQRSTNGRNKATITLYKIANDKDFLFKTDEKTREKYMSGDFMFPVNYTEEAKKTGFTPLVLEGNVKDGQVSQVIAKDKLSEGTYKLIINANNGCPGISSNFSVSSSNCTHSAIIKSIDCIGNTDASGNSKYRVCIDYQNTSNTGCTNCTILLNHPNNYSGGAIVTSMAATTVISNISPAPIQLTAGQTASICFDATVSTGNNLQFAVLATCKDGLETTAIPNHENELFNEVVKPCICNYCETIKWETNAQATATLQGNSININQPVTVTTSEQVVATKAEIIAFEQYVGDDCTTCNKTSSQWGNFNTGTFASLNGAFGIANSGVTGNTTHSLYWNASGSSVLPKTGTFNLNISAPPLSNLACCCSRLVITIRYTYSFKDSRTGICKMCSFIKRYTMQKGNCKIIAEPAGPVKADFPDTKNF